MRHPVLLRLLACAILFLVWCVTKNDSHDTGELTAAAAKDALIELIEQTNDGDLHRCLDPLTGAEPKTEDDRRIVKFGPVTCFISKRRFVLNINSAAGRGFIEWSGVFVPQDGKWVAKVEQKRQT